MAVALSGIGVLKAFTVTGGKVMVCAMIVGWTYSKMESLRAVSVSCESALMPQPQSVPSVVEATVKEVPEPTHN